MNQSELTDTVKRRLKQTPVCSICGEPIAEYHDVQYIKYRNKSHMWYNFFHTYCLEKSRKEIERS